MTVRNKIELLASTHQEFDRLKELVESIDDRTAQRSLEGISIKDIVGHRAHWIDLFIGWYYDGLNGRQVFFPAKGYSWRDRALYNSELRLRQTKLDWEEAKYLLDARYQKLLGMIYDMPETELFGAPMKGGQNYWTVGRWAEAAGPSHFKSASRFIRSILRAEPCLTGSYRADSE